MRAFAAFSLVWFVWSYAVSPHVGDFAAALGGSLLYSGLGFVVLGYAVRAAVRPGADRVWLPLVVGLGGSVLGDATWDLVDRGLLPGGNSTPSLVDLLYLPSYVALLGTVAWLIRRYHQPGAGSLLDTFVVGVGPVAAVFPWLIHPYVDAVQSGSLAARVLSVFYPTGDILIAASLAAAALGAGRLDSLRILTIAFGAGLVADHVYLAQSAAGTYTGGGWLDWLWMVQYFLIALAVQRPLPERLPPRTARTDAVYLAGLLGCAALAPAVLVGRLIWSIDTTADNLVYAVATLLLVAAVTVRLVGLVRENQRTVAELSAAVADAELLGAELRRQATHDGVTGLPNRQNLADRIARLDQAGPRRHSLIFVDLDDFKAVNDTFGHTVGDNLLRSLAQRLRALARREDLVVRLGGDEFAVLMPDTEPEDAAQVARRILGALKVGLEVGGHQVTVAATAGVAAMTGGGADRPVTGDDRSVDDRSEDVLARADLAMYAAKRAGKDQVLVYNDQMRAQVLGEAEIAQELARALKHGLLTAAYQPIVDLETGRMRGVEALARWQHLGNDIPPDVFLPIAEQRGLIAAIDLHVLELALQQAVHWRSQAPDLRVGFNMSAATLARDDLVESVLAALERYGLPGDALVVEITEQVLVRNADRAAEQLAALRGHGVEVALDDFGTGYSSLSYLQRFPIDVMKLDRSFVAEGIVDGEATPLLRMVIELGQRLGLGVLVEGLETVEQAQAVIAAGARSGQGWLFARAVPADDLPGLLGAQLAPQDLLEDDGSPDGVRPPTPAVPAQEGAAQLSSR
ncbi:putative bifunctional diguanylate cyclase/phosphodiesterase [Spongisporangium articulatum]|uniref:Bifunctional diguanylate cyclase/phosphodiesterase n=1 Tax=Spongisporangium articulatum TaxID=3362603 RepID=A0ABW8AK91_9ACTN